MPHVELHVSNGNQKGTVIPLPQGRFLIGREEDCQLRPNSDLVSRHHCVFTIDEYAVRLRDLGSTNGTFVNGERLRSAIELKHGDLVSVGRLEFRVVVPAQAEVEGDDTTVASFEDIDTLMESAETVAGTAPVDASPTLAGGDTLTEIPALDNETQVVTPATPPTPAAAETGFYYPAAPPMPYPGMPYGQPAYGYPGYPMQPMYPGMGYPPPGYPPSASFPQQPYPALAPPAPEAQVAQEPPPAASKTQEVRLPDPSETGAKPPEPKKDSGQSGGAQTIPDTAANIIKQYLQRRPT